VSWSENRNRDAGGLKSMDPVAPGERTSWFVFGSDPKQEIGPKTSCAEPSKLSLPNDSLHLIRGFALHAARGEIEEPSEVSSDSLPGRPRTHEPKNCTPRHTQAHRDIKAGKLKLHVVVLAKDSVPENLRQHNTPPF
jgi:hypothetical protein